MVEYWNVGTKRNTGMVEDWNIGKEPKIGSTVLYALLHLSNILLPRFCGRYFRDSLIKE